MATDLERLTIEIRKLNTAKGWRFSEPGCGNRDGYQFAAYIALAHSELSEALDAYRNKVWSDTIGAGIPADDKARDASKIGKPVGVGPELADVFIRVQDMCDIWGIDLEYEVKRVLAYGWTRPYRHGGRQL